MDTLQNIIVIIILIACALYIGQRMYNNFRNSRKGGGCGCSCSGCGPDTASTCSSKNITSEPK
ncbi:MAG: FeoB-associated Cys-rich membrane protein [Desulfobulbaceae bacterium]|nr:FeoB-associated Cys-rich membrane protein [Desulfobulbaceae bacterium]